MTNNNNNPFDNSLFNFGSSNNLFGASDDKGGNDLFNLSSNKPEDKPADKSADLQANTDLFGFPLDESKAEETAAPAEQPKASLSKAAPVKAEETAAPVKEDKSKAPAKTQGKKPEKALDLKKLRVNPAWTIAYAGRQTNPPEVDMSLDEVAEWLGLSYPEFSLGRTTWKADEERLLISPFPTNAKMG